MKVDGNFSKKVPGDELPGRLFLHPLQEQGLSTSDEIPAQPAHKVLSEQAEQGKARRDSQPAPVFIP